MFRPIVYKPLWDTFVFRFEFYETVSFLSSLEVLLRTTDPYLWISDSKWRIFLTYLEISSKWCDFLPFRKNPQSTSSIFPLFVLGFIPIFVLDEFLPKSETILHHIYRKIVGSLWYLCNTRPDISYNVGFISKYMHNPRVSNMNATKRVLRCVQGTHNFRILLPKKKQG